MCLLSVKIKSITYVVEFIRFLFLVTTDCTGVWSIPHIWDMEMCRDHEEKIKVDSKCCTFHVVQFSRLNDQLVGRALD
jgi:hypothetical protein